MTVRRHRVRGVDLAVDDPGGDGVPFVWAHGLTSCGALEDSVGVGIRWKLPMLMIGLDVAQALSEPDKNPRLHLNMTQVLR